MDKKCKFHWLNLKVEVREGGVEGEGVICQRKNL